MHFVFKGIYMKKKMISLLALMFVLASCSHSKELQEQNSQNFQQAVDKNYKIGKQIYRGDVRPDYSSKNEFYYERWAKVSDSKKTTNHITFSLDKKRLVVQSALEGKQSSLLRYDELHLQKQYTGSILIENNKVIITRRSKGKTYSAVEDFEHPVVVGPTLFGYIQKNWQSLNQGTEHVIAFGLIERLETFKFIIKKVSSNSDKTSFVLTPENMFYKLFVDDLDISFETNTKEVSRYYGPVPQYHKVDGELEKFMATSIYEYLR